MAAQYIEMDIGSLPRHKFEQWVGANFAQINKTTPTQELRYVLEVYMDNYIAAIIPTSKAQLIHIAKGILHRIHNVFPPSTNDSNNPILAKKLQKGDGTFENKKCILGFDFDGNRKTMWLEEEKRAALLTILHQWLCGAAKLKRGIPFCGIGIRNGKALTRVHGITQRARTP